MSKDFDAIAKAVQSGDHAALDKLMEEQPTETEEVIEEAAPLEVEEEEAAVEDTNESEESPKEVEEPQPEAAVTAASPVVDETEELKKEVQRYKSDAGRVPFIQRRMAELERELRAYKARDTQPTQGGSKPAASNVAGVELDEETQAQINELREVDPVMAKTMERIAKAAIAGSKQNVEAAITSYTQAEQEEADSRFLIEQQQELVRDVPRAYEIFATPQWSQWKETLTPGQRAMAESSYAHDVKQAIYAFAAAMQSSTPQAAEAAPVVAPPVSTETSDKVKQVRERKVGTSAEIKTGSAKKSVELNEEDYFAEMYEKVGKKNHLFNR